MSYLSCFGHIQVFASPRYSTYPRRALGILEKRHQRVIQVFLSPAPDGALEQLSPQTPNRDLSASPSPGPAQRHQDPRLPEVQPGVRSRNGLGRSAVPMNPWRGRWILHKDLLSGNHSWGQQGTRVPANTQRRRRESPPWKDFWNMISPTKIYHN